MDDLKIVAMIPARIGSTRLKMKNLALLNEKPLIYYSINAAQKSGIFDRIVINSDHEIFKEIAIRYGVEFYHRPSELGSSTTKSDNVVMDFIEKNPCDIVVWVNPISPLQNGEEVREIVRYFINKELDSLITVKNEGVHCVHKERPVNYDPEELFAQTQDLAPVQPFVYSVMMWRTDMFRREFEEKGFAFFCGRTGFYPVGKLSSIIIKRKEDLMFADIMLQSVAQEKEYHICYDKLADQIERI